MKDRQYADGEHCSSVKGGWQGRLLERVATGSSLTSADVSSIWRKQVVRIE